LNNTYQYSKEERKNQGKLYSHGSGAILRETPIPADQGANRSVPEKHHAAKETSFVHLAASRPKSKNSAG
jgi:hypothetical protein